MTNLSNIKLSLIKLGWWLSFFILIVFVIPLNFYNIAMYSLLIIFLIYVLISLVSSSVSFKKDTICEGVVFSCTRLESKDHKAEEYEVRIKFISPFDNKEYFIKTIQQKPHKQYKVKLNSRYPIKSKIVANFNYNEIVFLIIAIVLFSILLIREVLKVM